MALHNRAALASRDYQDFQGHEQLGNGKHLLMYRNIKACRGMCPYYTEVKQCDVNHLRVCDSNSDGKSSLEILEELFSDARIHLLYVIALLVRSISFIDVQLLFEAKIVNLFFKGRARTTDRTNGTRRWMMSI